MCRFLQRIPYGSSFPSSLCKESWVLSAPFPLEHKVLASIEMSGCLFAFYHRSTCGGSGGHLRGRRGNPPLIALHNRLLLGVHGIKRIPFFALLPCGPILTRSVFLYSKVFQEIADCVLKRIYAFLASAWVIFPRILIASHSAGKVFVCESVAMPFLEVAIFS